MEGPVRFECPPEFEAVTPRPPAGLCGGVLGGPGTEVWLIRAPADFCPERLEGCQVPLDGWGQLLPPQDEADDPGGYRLQGVPGGAGPPLLLAPPSPNTPLTCAPPFRGCITIIRSFGPPPGRRKKKKKGKEAEEPPQVTTSGGATPGEGGQGPPLDFGEVPEELEVPKKKKKKHKRERVE